MHRCSFTVSWFFVFYMCIAYLFLLESSFQPHHHLIPPKSLTLPSKVLMNVDGRIGQGIIINIYYCPTLQHRLKAVMLKDMLETYFPGVIVVLDMQPPVIRNRLIIRTIRLGSIAIIAAGENILWMIGVRVPHQMFYFMVINNSGFWNMLRVVVTILEITEAFEVHINGELIFSKLKEDRFPGEVELRELVSRKVLASIVVDGTGAGVLWSSRIKG